MDSYGKELILDIHECDISTFTRESIEKYCKELCKLIDMVPCELHFWDFEDDPDGYAEAPDHIKGMSAIQFITTSNITIHTLDVLKKVFVNIFTCKDFDGITARDFSATWFHGKIVSSKVMDRL